MCIDTGTRRSDGRDEDAMIDEYAMIHDDRLTTYLRELLVCYIVNICKSLEVTKSTSSLLRIYSTDEYICSLLLSTIQNYSNRSSLFNLTEL